MANYFYHHKMEGFSGENMLENAPYSVNEKNEVVDNNGNIIGKLKRSRSWYRECTLTDTSLCYHGLKTEEDYLFYSIMEKLKPLEDLWRKENSPEKFVLPDTGNLIKWACVKIAGGEKCLIMANSQGASNEAQKQACFIPHVSGMCEHPLASLMFWSTGEVECKICGYKSLTF